MAHLLDGHDISRRGLIGSALLAAGGLAAGGMMAGQALATSFPAITLPPHYGPVRPQLMARALAAFQRHAGDIPQRDVIAIADFAQPSSVARFHILDMVSGRVNTLLVAHGKGSDPAHSGMLQRFSNVDGSEASSSGTYRTDDLYVGKHGRSRRLVGLDASNCNAEARAIVMHGAWYVSYDLVGQHGKIGRSQGCLAVSETDLEQVLARLGPGRMIYSDKV